jgi:hypothetical protein
VAAQLGAIAAGCSIIDLAIEKFARGRKFIASARARAGLPVAAAAIHRSYY